MKHECEKCVLLFRNVKQRYAFFLFYLFSLILSCCFPVYLSFLCLSFRAHSTFLCGCFGIDIEIVVETITFCVQNIQRWNTMDFIVLFIKVFSASAVSNQFDSLQSIHCEWTIFGIQRTRSKFSIRHVFYSLATPKSMVLLFGFNFCTFVTHIFFRRMCAR